MFIFQTTIAYTLYKLSRAGIGISFPFFADHHSSFLKPFYLLPSSYTSMTHLYCVYSYQFSLLNFCSSSLRKLINFITFSPGIPFLFFHLYIRLQSAPWNEIQSFVTRYFLFYILLYNTKPHFHFSQSSILSSFLLYIFLFVFTPDLSVHKLSCHSPSNIRFTIFCLYIY